LVIQSYSYNIEIKHNIDYQVGICGEHGGEPSSVAFFAEIGLDYVSCSPFRSDFQFNNIRK